MGILNLLLISTLCLWPLGVMIRLNIMPSVYIYPIDIVLIVLFLYSVYQSMVQKPVIHPVITSYLILIIVMAVSLLANLYWLRADQFAVALLYIGRFVIYANLIYVLIAFRDSITLPFMIIAGIGIIFVLLGIGQYFIFPDLRGWYQYGWDDHLYRLFSTLLDPNFTGAVLVLHVIVSLYLWVKCRNRLRYIFLVSCIVTLAAIFLTYSRTAYIMLLVSVPVALYTLGKFRYVLLFVSILAIGLILLPKNLRSEGVDLLRTSSITARVTEYRKALIIFSHSPIIGVGFNSYKYAQEREGYKLTLNSHESHSDAGVPNSYLFVLATTGLVGLIAFLNIFRVIIQQYYKNRHKTRYQLLLSTTAAILVGSLFENIYFFPFIMVWYFAVSGFCLSQKNITVET